MVGDPTPPTSPRHDGGSPLDGDERRRLVAPLTSSTTTTTKTTPSVASSSSSFYGSTPNHRILYVAPPVTTTARKDPEDDQSDDDNDDDDDDDVDDESSYLMKKERMLARSAHFDLMYSEERGFRATEFPASKACSFQRPHMRAFQAAWICSFASYAVQFSMAPLLPQLQQSLNLTKQDVWLTNVWMVVGGVPMRFVLGPLCDWYGPRLVMVAMLVSCAVPCAASGLVITNLFSLVVVRTLMGAADAFVPSQCWITAQFVREVSGTVMAIVAGVGGTGSAFAQLAVGFLFVGFENALSSDNDSDNAANNDVENDIDARTADLAWKLALVVPAVAALLVAWWAYLCTDDCPLGNLDDVKKAGLMFERSAVDSFRTGAINLNSWLLFLQYAGTSGVDVTFSNGCAIYYHARFHKTIAETGILCFFYGISALYARGLGGLLSDKIGDKFSVEGRLWTHFGCMLSQGVINIWFARIDTFSHSVSVMILLSILIQMATGTCFGIIPYVDSANTSSVAGIVGAGGNVGAIFMGLLFMYQDYADAMEYMAYFTIATAFLTPLIVIKGYKGMVFGEDNFGDASRQQHCPLLVPKMQHSPHFVKLKQKRRKTQGG